MSETRTIGSMFSFAILTVLVAACILVLADVGEPALPDSDLAVLQTIEE